MTWGGGGGGATSAWGGTLGGVSPPQAAAMLRRMAPMHAEEDIRMGLNVQNGYGDVVANASSR